MSSLPEKWFFRGPIPKVRPIETPDPTPPVDLPPGAPSHEALLATEIRAYAALHSVQACLGEDVEVSKPNGSEIVVKGLVQNQARKDQLGQALAGLSYLTFRVETIENAMKTEPPANPVVVAAPADPAIAMRRRKAPLLEFAKEYWTARGVALEVVSDRVITLGNTVIAAGEKRRNR